MLKYSIPLMSVLSLVVSDAANAVNLPRFSAVEGQTVDFSPLISLGIASGNPCALGVTVSEEELEFVRVFKRAHNVIDCVKREQDECRKYHPIVIARCREFINSGTMNEVSSVVLDELDRNTLIAVPLLDSTYRRKSLYCDAALANFAKYPKLLKLTTDLSIHLDLGRSMRNPANCNLLSNFSDRIKTITYQEESIAECTVDFIEQTLISGVEKIKLNESSFINPRVRKKFFSTIGHYNAYGTLTADEFMNITWTRNAI